MREDNMDYLMSMILQLSWFQLASEGMIWLPLDHCESSCGVVKPFLERSRQHIVWVLPAS